uniref:Uncharacterized protein n=1 Tax=Chaetoceros debilis TaxID=122233 RepID=A0A7S3V746_9STRA|mmetsp:Transcript_9464/g.14185  ORF Transcript_9464/g.14185 Transcript_9464/m.14185 type:complete len:181 (+) Transcript_9464:91-633(+)
MSGINPDGSLKKFFTPTPSSDIAIAASTGDLSALERLLTPTTVTEKDEHGNTPLVWASDCGQSAAVKLILDQTPADESINAKGYLGNTALGRAARGGHADCVALLLERDEIDANICNEKKQYPLHFAAFKKKTNCVKLMLESGKVDTCVIDRKGRTPAEDTSVDEIRDMILGYRDSNTTK